MAMLQNWQIPSQEKMTPKGQSAQKSLRLFYGSISALSASQLHSAPRTCVTHLRIIIMEISRSLGIQEAIIP